MITLLLLLDYMVVGICGDGDGHSWSSSLICLWKASLVSYRLCVFNSPVEKGKLMGGWFPTVFPSYGESDEGIRKNVVTGKHRQRGNNNMDTLTTNSEGEFILHEHNTKYPTIYYRYFFLNKK